MQNKTFGIVGIILVLILGYWLFNTPKGAMFREQARSNSQTAAVYRGPSDGRNTLVQTDSNPGYNYNNSYAVRQQPAQMAYITYPIAKSTGSSQYSAPTVAPPTASYTTTSSAYYVEPDPGYNYYQNPTPQGGCYVGGCSNQICSDQPGGMSTCEYRPEYACYQTAKCERQSTGQCGWTMTSQLNSCLSNSR